MVANIMVAQLGYSLNETSQFYGLKKSAIIDDENENGSLTINWTSNFIEVWNDSGSGAAKDVGIWRPNELPPGYYSLGDIAVGQRGEPSQPALVAFANDPAALAPPESYSEIWTDRKSGANADVTFWRPIAPSGYTCLGDVATPWWGSYPTKDALRCVRNDLVDLTPSEPIIHWKTEQLGNISIYRDGNYVDSVEVSAGNWVDSNAGSMKIDYTLELNNSPVSYRYCPE